MYIKNFIDIGLRDISMEVVGDSKTNDRRRNQTLRQNLEVHATIKVPCTPDGLLAVCRRVCKNLIRVNVTLIFDVAQAILSSKGRCSIRFTFRW